MLDFSLIIYSRKRVLARKILWLNAHKQCAVGVFSVTGKAAHAVYYNAALFACGRHNGSAGAHAKCVCSALVQAVAGKLVVCRAELFVAREIAVLRFVYKLLRVLYSCTHGKRLLNNFTAQIIKHFNGVSCAVAYCHDNAVCLNVEKLAAVRIGKPLNEIVVNNQLFNLAFKAHFAAEFFNLFAYVFNHYRKPVRADVRL